MTAAIAGIAILAAICLDFLLTTIAITDRLLPSRRISAGVWRLLTRVLPDAGWSRIVVGPFVMAAIAAFWIGGVALGWFLIFQASPGAVIDPGTGGPAGPVLDLGFIGKALSTIGGGIGRPGSGLWELVTVVVGVNGMVVLTLSVSFVLNTTQTVALGRSFLSAAEARVELGQDRTAGLETLAKLVADLNSVPHALYFSSADPRRRLPEGLLAFARNWYDDRQSLAGLRGILEDLPNFSPDRDAAGLEFLKALERWSKDYIFGASASPGPDTEGTGRTRG